MLTYDEANNRVIERPWELFGLGLILAVLLALELAGITNLRRHGDPTLTRLLLGLGAFGLSIAGVFRWRSIQRVGQRVHVTSLFGSKRFDAKGLTVTVIETQGFRASALSTRQRRERWVVRLEDRNSKLNIASCNASHKAQGVAGKVRSALGLSLYEPWKG
ncbi:MAG: hypothetical protein JRF33_06845 [Deltaproteobacteria bacterium]|nr:hypothetical protein [Deltaproteobacteria bacterium]